MKPREKGSLKSDVEELLEKSTVAEATDKVFHHFEKALEQLDADSLKLIRSYFNGSTASMLSREWGLSEIEIKAWIAKTRRELVQHLRKECRVRQ